MKKRTVLFVVLLSLALARLPLAGATIRGDHAYAGKEPAGSAITPSPSSAVTAGCWSLCRASVIGARPIAQAQPIARSGIQRQRRTTPPK